MTMTMSDMVATTREFASSVHSERIAVLAQDWTATEIGVESDLEFTYQPQQMFPGMIICAGPMTWYVSRVPTGASTTVRVLPAPEGYEPTAVPAGTICRLSPRFTDRTIFARLNEQIRAMSSPGNGLYRAYTWQVDVNLTDQMYLIPVQAEGFHSVISIVTKPSGIDNWRTLHNYEIHQEAGTGYIRLFDCLNTGVVRFTVRMPFSEAVYFTEDPILVCGLSPSMVDIPPLGAAALLLMSEEGRRLSLQAQGDPRRADETPPTALATQSRELLRMRDRRIDEEAAKLAAVYAIRRQRS